MILPDSSIWIDFFRHETGAPGMFEKLEQGEIVLHPWVLGELIVGDLGKLRAKVLTELRQLPLLDAYPVGEINTFVEHHRLSGRGLSFIDAQILYCSLVDGYRLWTKDKILQKYSRYLNVHWESQRNPD